MAKMADPEQLGRLYSDAFGWLVQNGQAFPADVSGSQVQLATDGLPIVDSRAEHHAALTADELWRIAPAAASALRVEGGAGNLTMSAFEAAHIRNPNVTGDLPVKAGSVLFTVEYAANGPVVETSYGLDDPLIGLDPNTIHTLRGLDRELAVLSGGPTAFFGAGPDQLIHGIEEAHGNALQGIIDALKVHWPSIKAARRNAL